jgi:uncharacterized membrane protein YeiB
MDRSSSSSLAPTAGNERIEALDVIRGFALIGICIMNVEYFNRAIADLGRGINPNLTGTDFIISFITQYFVTGKFWTIFSLLFGMGFAVMLTRADQAGRSFLAPYLRRIFALAVFGACHSIFLWSGDILFSYSVAAACLLITMYGRPKYIAAGIVLCVLVGLAPKAAVLAGVPEKSAPDLGAFLGIAGGLAYFSLIGWWLRGETRVRKLNMPAVALLLLVVGIIALIAAVVMWLVPGTPREARLGLPVFGLVVTILGILSHKFHEPKSERPWRLGVGMYVFSFSMMTGIGGMMYMLPEKPETVAQAGAVASPEADKATKAKAEKAAERAKRLKEREEAVKKEVQVSTSGTYAEHLALRAERFAKHAPGEVGFATILVGMFLLGSWFVRSGIMENTRAHLSLFRKLALFGLPSGIGLGLLGASIAMHSVPGSNGADGYQLASGLLMLGNLPACLGYVGLVVLMLHSGSVFSRIRVLAPFGRMALTNYLTQSVGGALYYFGWGFGHYGASRLHQMAYVACLVVLQIAFSHFWLSRFRYGPMEWLWRAFTYWTIPPMSLEKPSRVAVAAGVR